MFLIELTQQENVTQLALFETLKEAKTFVQQLPSYQVIKEDGFETEILQPEKLPAYLEINYHQHIVIISRFMFPLNDIIYIDIKELPNLSQKGDGYFFGTTRIDAYHVNNQEVKGYLCKREANYLIIKKHLENIGYEVSRSFLGSQDGEAIVYRKSHDSTWHFLVHLDPIFVENDDILAILDDIL